MTLEQAIAHNPYNPLLGKLGAYIRYLRYNVDGFYAIPSKCIREKYADYIERNKDKTNFRR